MSLTLVKVDGFYHCEGLNCNSKSKKLNGISYFKGKYLCHWCKLKASKFSGYIPLLNPSENTLKKIRYKDIGLDYKKIERKPRKFPFRIIDNLKNWANGDKVVSVGLTKDEHSILWRHFYSQGFNDYKIKKSIEKVKESIRTSHEEFKQGIRQIKPTFQEEFNKLIEVKNVYSK